MSGEYKKPEKMECYLCGRDHHPDFCGLAPLKNLKKIRVALGEISFFALLIFLALCVNNCGGCTS